VQKHGHEWDRLSALFPGRTEADLRRRWAVVASQANSESPRTSTIDDLPDSIIQKGQDYRVPQEATQIGAASGAGFQFDDDFWDQVRRDNAVIWFD
jgi:hypothetical protein